MTAEHVPEWMSTIGRMAMQVEGELSRLKAKAARSSTDELHAIARLAGVDRARCWQRL